MVKVIKNALVNGEITDILIDEMAIAAYRYEVMAMMRAVVLRFRVL